MREVSPGQLHLGSKVLASEAAEALSAELQTGLDELDVWSLAKGVIDDGLILVDGDGARRVDDVTAR